MKKLVLIDGHSILNRAFYGVPDLTNSEGLHTNAVYGFLNIMFKILDEEQPDYLTVAFDLSAPTFRHKMFDEYKGTRKPMPEELRQQVPLIKEALAAMDIVTVSKEGYEADDILGTLATRAQAEGILVSVVSGDRDLLQLATDRIKIRIPKTKKGVTEIEDYNTEDVVKLYSVTPTEFIDMKALMGDTSDNILGVPKIGEKTAGAIIAKFHSIENAYAHLDEIKPNLAKTNLGLYYEQAVLSKKLATIITDAPIDYDINDAGLDNMFNDNSYNFFKRMNFKSMLKRFDDIKAASAEPSGGLVIRLIEDRENAEEFAASISSDAGIFMVSDDGEKLLAMAVSTGDKDNVTAFLPVGDNLASNYLSGLCLRICSDLKLKGRRAGFVQLKEQLGLFGNDEPALADDVALMAYLVNPLKDSYMYDDISRDFLGSIMPSRSELMGKSGFASFMDNLCGDDGAYNAGVVCACDNAYVALKSLNVLTKALDDAGMLKLYHDMELPLVYVLRSMEKEGIRVDKDALVAYGDMLRARIAELEGVIHELAGEEFNINSPKQLGAILFEKLGLKGGKKTKTGYSTSADVLEKLADKHEIIRHILEYRQLSKLNSTYAEGLITYILDDGRIHGKFNQSITATGRISSTEPNLQNIPIRTELGSRIRSVFIPKDGYVFLDSDYSQIELRILAHMSGDERLIAAYNSDEDIHRITASQVFNIPFEEVTKTQRSNAKAVNFGIVYGISSFGLSQDLSISRKEAAEYIEQYFVTYPQVKSFLDGLVDSAKANGYSTTYFGRRRPIPELKNSNFMQRQFGERVAMNAPIQGTAADIIKLAMIGVYNRLKKENLKSRLILQVHDELLVETAKDEVDVVRRIIDEEMKGAASLSVPLVVDTNEGSNWLEAH